MSARVRSFFMLWAGGYSLTTSPKILVNRIAWAGAMMQPFRSSISTPR